MGCLTCGAVKAVKHDAGRLECSERMFVISSTKAVKRCRGWFCLLKFMGSAVPSGGFVNGEWDATLMDGSCLWWVAFLSVFNAHGRGEDN